MAVTLLPLVPQVSQWDGSSHQSENCTCASTARLADYAFGIKTSGGRIRDCQSDQSGGTSIPDVLRGLKRCFGRQVAWAAPNDSNAGRDDPPPGKQGEWITDNRLWSLIDDGYMVLVQGDYGDLPLQYREQTTFTGDHAFTVDDVRNTPTRGREVYVVDTIPRYSEHYDGRWIPWSALLAYAFGLSGNGRVYAAWAKPADPTPEDPMGLDVNHLSNAVGTVTVKGSGHDIIRIATNSRSSVPAGQRRVVIAKVKALQPIDGNAGDRQTGYLVAGIVDGEDDYSLGFLLASDVDVDDVVLITAREA